MANRRVWTGSGPRAIDPSNIDRSFCWGIQTMKRNMGPALTELLAQGSRKRFATAEHLTDAGKRFLVDLINEGL
jgi:hypothetical protein